MRGAYFAGVLEEGRNAVDPWPALVNDRCYSGLSLYERNSLARRHVGGFGWEHYLAPDFGVSAPSVTYLVARSPGIEGPNGRFYPRGSLVLVDELATVNGENLNQGRGLTVPALAAEIRRFCERWDVEPAGCADDAIFARTGSGAGTARSAGGVSSGARRPDGPDTTAPDHAVDAVDAVRYALMWQRQSGGVIRATTGVVEARSARRYSVCVISRPVGQQWESTLTQQRQSSFK